MKGKGLQAGEGDGERRLPRPPRPSGCRQFARKTFAASLPAILDCFVTEATKGSIPHAKALMTMAGLDNEEVAEPRRRDRRSAGGARSLSELLLTELRRTPEGK